MIYNFTEAKVADFITMLKDKFSDCQIGLSLGQRSEKTYRKWFEAGAVRYELSHETAAENHFKKLHPPDMGIKEHRVSGRHRIYGGVSISDGSGCC